MEKILQKQNISKPVISISKKTTLAHLVSTLAFFIGRIVIFKTVNPVALAYLSCHAFTNTYYTTAIFLLLGILTRQKQIYISRYIFSIAALSLLQAILNKTAKKITPFKQALTGSIATLVGGLAFSAINDFSLYFATLAILEAVLTLFLSLVLNRGVKLFRIQSTTKSISPEDFLSISLVAFAIIVGSANVEICTIPITYLLVSLCLIVLSYHSTLALSISASALLGTILVLTNIQGGQIIPALIIPCGICSMFKKRYKPLSLIAFWLSGWVALNCFMPELISLKLMYTVAIASVIFLLIPEDFYQSMLALIDEKPPNEMDYMEQFKEIAAHKLRGFSSAFTQLSRSITNISDVTVKNDIKDVTTMVDEIANKVCAGCSLRPFCWENNFYSTYQTIFGILGACETKGSFDTSAVPKGFKDGCVRFDSFITTTTQIYELNKLNQLWLKQISENRSLISKQLSSVSSIIYSLCGELDKEFNFDKEKSLRLYKALKAKNINVDNVIIHTKTDGRCEVLLKHKPCYGCNRCIRDIVPEISQILGQKMARQNFDCQITNSPTSSCRLCLVEDKRFHISSCTAKAIKSDSKISGDSHTFMELPNGNYLLALSDGMGSGQKAREESAASIELFEDFMSAGFDKHTALNMINSALFLKSSDDFFSTLDICTINLYTGTAEFVKIGASSTFIVHDDKVEVVKSSTLPVGILHTIDTDICERQLYNNDIIVMVTDGVLDSSNSPLNKEEWIVSLLSKNIPSQPQEVAHLVLSEAKKNYGEQLSDDMTVLVSKIWS